MNRRDLLVGVAAMPIARALDLHARTHTVVPVDGWISVSELDAVVGRYVHLYCDGDHWIINGVLADTREETTWADC